MLLGTALVLLVVIPAHLTRADTEWSLPVTAVAALCAILSEVALVAFLTQNRPLARIGLAAAFLLIIGLTNGSSYYKLKYPGLDVSYAGLDHRSIRPLGGDGNPKDVSRNLPVPKQKDPTAAAKAIATGKALLRRLVEEESKGYTLPDGLRLKLLGEASEWFRQATRLNPDNADCWEALGKALATKGFDLFEQPEEIEEGLAAMQIVVRLRNAQPVIGHDFNPYNLDDANPCEVLAGFYLCSCWKNMLFDNVPGVFSDISNAIRFDPENQLYWRTRSEINHILGEYERAASDYKHMKSMSNKIPKSKLVDNVYTKPIDIEACRWRGMRKLRVADYAGALDDFEQVLKRFANDVQAKTLADLSRIMKSDADDTIGRLDKLTASGVDRALIELARADYFARRAETAEAIKACSLAAALDPEDPTALTARASYHFTLGDGDEARKDQLIAVKRRERAESLAQEKRTSEGLLTYSDISGPSRPDPSQRRWNLVGDRRALGAWLQSAAEHPSSPATKHSKPQNPILVVVATSGGGITAAYWTAKCLAEIEKKHPIFPSHLRMVFGSSGGMIGAAAYVAEVRKPPDPDGPSRRAALAEAVGKDHLTPTIRRMLLGDLSSILDRRDQEEDRGRTLEDAWAKNIGPAFAQPFEMLRKGEAEGWRPSLVISPMIVEDAKFLLISNLDLGGLEGADELFKLYPKDRKTFALGTALRMNAAFPLVSPGAYLPPTRELPARRVVDAGYLDNYGVRLACAWIEKHKGWLLAHTGGVLLIQLRAYAADDQQDTGRVSLGLQPFLTPIEGVDSSRRNTMRASNDAAVARLNDWFNQDEPVDRTFFESVELVNTSNTPLGWSLTSAERKAIDKSVAQVVESDGFRRILEKLGDSRESPPKK